jgi:hypothetical protein
VDAPAAAVRVVYTAYDFLTNPAHLTHEPLGLVIVALVAPALVRGVLALHACRRLSWHDCVVRP